jgi:pimeloyl-ACP methyl ester carboxylesterase
MTDPRLHKINIAGSNACYWIFNPKQKKTIVMVHGFRGNHFGLQDIYALLTDFRIIIPDLPGFGESTPMRTQPHDVEGYSTFIEELIRELKLEKPALLGHSFGSIIAASVAARSPQLVGKLILVNPIASPALQGRRTFWNYSTKLYYQLGAALPEKPGLALLSSRAIVRLTSFLLTTTKDKKLRRDIFQHHLRHFSSFQSRDVLLEAFDASIAHTVLDYASNIHMPTLLIAGGADDIAPLHAQQKLEHQLLDAQLVSIPNVGHLIHREAPAKAAKAIIVFLS